jgi:hypothetical protein
MIAFFIAIIYNLSGLSRSSCAMVGDSWYHHHFIYIKMLCLVRGILFTFGAFIIDNILVSLLSNGPACGL